MVALGQRLTYWRQRRGMSQQELADRSGVPYMTIYRLEDGIYADTRSLTAAKLAWALGISLDTLAGIAAPDGDDGHDELASGS